MATDQRAADILARYMQEAWEAAGLTWEALNDSEISTAVERIVNAGRGYPLPGQVGRAGDGSRREAGHTAPPVIRIPLAGVPSHCPYCGVSAAFPLTVFGNQVSASCPACFRIVAPAAVTSPGDARRAPVSELLGADPDWCGELTIDEYVAEQRADRYEHDGGNQS